MKIRKILRGSALAAATGALLVVGLSPAVAEEYITGPETPHNTSELPLVHTTRNGALKPNLLNAHPVCNAWSEYRTIIHRLDEKFKPLGTVQMTNRNSSGSVDLQQSITRSSTFSLSLTGDIGGSFSGVSASIQPSVSYSVSWSAGQNIGPVAVPAGHTAYATYGFNYVTFSGTQQRCLLDGTWSAPWAYFGTAPRATAVRVATVKSSTGSLPTQVLDSLNGQNQPSAALIPADPANPVTPATPNTAHDLGVSFTSSAVKAPGFAGAVAVHVKNEGTKYYYDKKKPTTFKLSVVTADGPTGIDRIMNIVPLGGATARDLGFDEATSTRTWLITLNNPVYRGKSAMVGTIWFHDGLTSEGRIKSKIVATQVTRMDDDNNYANDYRVDSSTATKSDGGRLLNGILF